MRESEIERRLVWAVEMAGGKTWKFNSPSQRGVADRIACLPDGRTFFVELKTRGGRLSPLQKLFGAEMTRLGQRYVVLNSIEEVDAWILNLKSQPTCATTQRLENCSGEQP